MGVDKAKLLAGKQLLAAMLNVCAYEAWVDGKEWASADVGMDPDAMVYPCGLTVGDIIDHAALGLTGMTEGDISHVLDGKDLLDKMNNAESNGYEAFVYTEFEPRDCPIELRENPPYKNVTAPGEDVAGSVVMVGDSTNDEVVVFVYLDSGDLNSNYIVYLEEYTGTTGGAANWEDYDNLGNFTTDSHGHGSFYVRVPVAVLDLAGPDYYLQIVLRQWGVFGTDIAEITIT